MKSQSCWGGGQPQPPVRRTQIHSPRSRVLPEGSPPAGCAGRLVPGPALVLRGNPALSTHRASAGSE